MSKQMRVSDVQYKLLVKLSEKLGVDKIEIMNNMIGIMQKIVDNCALSVKIVCKDGTEKELFLSFIGLNGNGEEK